MFHASQVAREGLLAPVSFELNAGEMLLVSGVSGAGKSLLLRALADLDTHSGQVVLDGREQKEVSPCIWRQSVMWFSAETAWWHEEVKCHFETKAKDEVGWLEKNLEKLHLSTGILEKKVHELSSGEKQRLALLRGLQKRPEVLLLDETTANLDEASTLALEDFIEDYLRSFPSCALWVTHDVAQRERLQTHFEGIKTLELIPWVKQYKN